mmetsp:Transcript_51389/g.165030  ORF Transcript_51389/g.165030 Transcript_51389/m.165030 type:complete len:202 (-) Transcript_51389:926-1531(-)
MALPTFMLASAMTWLSRPHFVALGPQAQQESLPPVIFTACNWYNSWKLPTLLAAMREHPDSPVLVIGGLGRLASASAVALGAEAYEMRELLLRSGASASRVTAVGCFECGNATGLGACHCVGNTGFNVDRLVDRALVTSQWRGRRLLVVEESFLARRVYATVLARLRNAGEAAGGGEVGVGRSPPLGAVQRRPELAHFSTG